MTPDLEHQAAMMVAQRTMASRFSAYGWDKRLGELSEAQVQDLIESAVCAYERARWGHTNMLPF
jgi:hypothetical protein